MDFFFHLARARSRSRAIERKRRKKRALFVFSFFSYLRIRVDDVEVDSGEVGRQHPVDGVAASASDADDLVDVFFFLKEGKKKVRSNERKKKVKVER